MGKGKEGEFHNVKSFENVKEEDYSECKSFNSVKEMLNAFDEREMNKLWIVKLWDKYIWHPLYRAYHNVLYFPKEAKWFIQRGMRGYSDLDNWNLGYYVLKVLSKGAAQLRDNHHGYPHELSNKKWTSILNEIAEGCKVGELIFEGGVDILDEKGNFKDFQSYTDEEFDEIRGQLKKALRLFSRYCLAMWD